MSEYLSEGMRYSIDGDIIDERDKLLSKARREALSYKQQAQKEEKLREQHPALQDAWEKYQTILRLVENA